MTTSTASRRAERAARDVADQLHKVDRVAKAVLEPNGAVVVPELDEAAIAALVDRLWYDGQADGWPADLGDDGMPRSDDPEALNGVEAAAEARIDGRSDRDPVADAVNRILADLRDMAERAERVRKLRIWLAHEQRRAAGRQSALAGDCKVCLASASGAENDRLRSGLCVRCYRRWTRRAKPELTPVEERTDLRSIDRGVTIRYWFPGCGFLVETFEDRRGDTHMHMVVDRQFEVAEQVWLGDGTVNAADLLERECPHVCCRATAGLGQVHDHLAADGSTVRPGDCRACAMVAA